MKSNMQVLNVRTITSKGTGKQSVIVQAMESPGPDASLRGLVEFFAPDGMNPSIGAVVGVKVTEFRSLYKGVAQISVQPAK